MLIEVPDAAVARADRFLKRPGRPDIVDAGEPRVPDCADRVTDDRFVDRKESYGLGMLAGRHFDEHRAVARLLVDLLEDFGLDVRLILDIGVEHDPALAPKFREAKARLGALREADEDDCVVPFGTI